MTDGLVARGMSPTFSPWFMAPCRVPTP